MSALPQRGPHMRELFVQKGPGSTPQGAASGSFQFDQQESRSTYDMGSKKKRRAPPPPVGLGQYKPKILSEEASSNVPVNRASGGGSGVGAESPVRPPRPSKTPSLDNSSNNNGGSDGGGSGRPLIMGDKDTPLVLHASRDTHDLDRDVSKLRLTPHTDMPGQEGSLGTDNPLFRVHEEDGDVSMPNAGEQKKEGEQPLVENGEPDGVYIPEPDYDEEEKTMIFPDDDDDDEPSSLHNGKKVYREYYGEDFAQYLSDEENGLEAVPMRQKRSSNNPTDRKSRTEVKRPHYKKREALSSKSKKEKTVSGSNSLRNFSFADSKFGTLTRGSSGKRHSVPSLSEGSEEAELFVNTGSSYEDFLRSKNGEELDLFHDHLVQNGAGLPGAPPRYVHPAHKKDTLWKKLTWKFKKQSRNSLDLTTT